MDTLTQATHEYEILPYRREMASRWDEFVAASRNGTFLLTRTYMDYHADRFEDCSLVALRKGKPVALLPACRCHSEEGDVLSSHAGLTYGGWILPAAHLDGAMLLDLFRAWLRWCCGAGFRRIVYKPVPYIYHRQPSQEDLYALWRYGFTRSAVNLSSAVDMRLGSHFNMSKRQQLRKAMGHNPMIEESHDFGAFWALLGDCLASRHAAAPVHSLEEIKRLAASFPDRIRLFTLSDADGLQAGVCIYDTDPVAHSQYAATTPEARRRGYLTALYHHLLTEVFTSRRYFDFGTSNEERGHVLNTGLLNQKFSMGATGVVYEQYYLDLT